MTTEERLEKLERELARARRRNRFALGFAALAVVGLLVWGCSSQGRQSGAIRANEFILEDEQGRPRARLSVNEGGPSLSLLDEKGTIRALLDGDDDLPMLALSDENGITRASLSGDKDEPSLTLLDENETIRAALYVDKAKPRLTLSDQNGTTRAWLSGDDDLPHLSLSDEHGTIRAVFLLMGKLGPHLILSDAEGRPIWGVP